MATWEEVGEEVRAIADAQEAERYARDPRVVAIRRDPVIGRGTCSIIDECWTDRQLVEKLNAFPDAHTLGGVRRIVSPRLAVAMIQLLHDAHERRQQEIESTAF